MDKNTNREQENEKLVELKNDFDTDFDFSSDFEHIEDDLSAQLEESFSELSLLEEDRKNIANPDSLGKAILDEVWTQFGNQIGLDLTNETLIQQYDREHPESYDEIKTDILKDKAYVNARKQMKSDQIDGTLTNVYTGKIIKPGDKFDVEHVIPRKKIYLSQRRKQAKKSTQELANKKENMQATTDSLNRSKQDKSVVEYLKNRAQREADLIAGNDRANKKIDDSNRSDVEKRLQIEKNNKALQDKLDADNKLMKKADKTARKAINKDIVFGATKEIGIKAGKDALKAMAISALFNLLKEIMNGFVRFIKSQVKTFRNFLAEMKVAIKSFFSKIMNLIQTGASALIGTIASEIFGPIVSVFKKLTSFIKQGVSSFIDVLAYLKDKSNKYKPFSVKVAQIGKIVTAGLTVGSAIVLGEVFEKFLLTVPAMQITLPLLGTLANIIGLFLGSLISGLVGAIVLNLIDNFIAKQLRNESGKGIIEKNNSIAHIQLLQEYVAENKTEKTKARVSAEISERHDFLQEHIVASMGTQTKDSNKNASDENIVITKNNGNLLQMQTELDEMLLGGNA